jgi:ankyrin repeat protein
MKASYEGRNAIAQLLLDHCALVDIKNSNDGSALMYASRQGHTATVQLLLHHGALVDIQNNNGLML